jgi:hypothetical protein
LVGVATILAFVLGAAGPGASSAQAAANPAKLVTKIRLGPSPFTPILAGVGVDTATGKVYVAAYNPAFSNEGYVYVVHGDNVEATIHVCPNANGVAVDSNTDMIYVNCRTIDGFSVVPAVYVINGRTNRVSAVIKGIIGIGPMALDAKTGLLYLAGYNVESVSVVNMRTNKFVTNLTVPYPTAIAVDPATNTIYPNPEGTVSVINGKTNAVTTPFTTALTKAAATAAGGIGVDDATDTVYFTGASTGGAFGLWSINARTHKLAHPLNFGVGYTLISNGLEVGPGTNTIYAIGTSASGVAGAPGTLVIINARTKKVTATFDGVDSPGALAVDPTNGNVYVTGTVAVPATDLTIGHNQGYLYVVHVA